MVLPLALPFQTSCWIVFLQKCSPTKPSASAGKKTGRVNILRFMKIRAISTVITNAITTASSLECAP